MDTEPKTHRQSHMSVSKPSVHITDSTWASLGSKQQRGVASDAVTWLTRYVEAGQFTTGHLHCTRAIAQAIKTEVPGLSELQVNQLSTAFEDMATDLDCARQGH